MGAGLLAISPGVNGASASRAKWRPSSVPCSPPVMRGSCLPSQPEPHRGIAFAGRQLAGSAAAGAAAAAAAAWQLAWVGGSCKLARRQRRRRRGRLPRRAGETIELFRRFGPEDDPFEIQIDQVLGVGGQGTVYRCSRVKDPSKVFAAKAVPIWRLENDPESSNKLAVFEKEMEVIQRVQGHPNIAKCFGCWDVAHPLGKDALPAMYKMMVVELVEGSSLASMIAEQGRLDEHVARTIFRQVLAGTKFMHGCKVLHRDLKCDNILVRSDMTTGDVQVKLIDFGVARVISNSYAQSCVGTQEILAPEVVCAKLMIAPQGTDVRTSGPLKFASPQEMSPGFGLATARPDGSGALVNGLEPGGQGEARGVRDGWAIARINGVEAADLPFLPDPEAPQGRSIVGMLQGLETAFTLEFIELPKREFTEAVDFWSLGCVLYTMLAGKVPFAGERDIVAGSYSEDLIAHCSDDARDLIWLLLKSDPRERAGCGQVEAHPWLVRAA